MGLKDRLTEQLAISESRCAVHRLRQDMTADDRKAFDAAVGQIRDMKERNLTVGKYGQNAVWLLRGLEAEGYKMTLTPLQKHIRRDCGCSN